MVEMGPHTGFADASEAGVGVNFALPDPQGVAKQTLSTNNNLRFVFVPFLCFNTEK
ncbi:MAG: hypothetical protein KatS3mg050_3335 [Litorilinea sp.]|nr:MAG: hypothetical protein KatS3mg050_3335 [Litorilinea sp.]